VIIVWRVVDSCNLSCPFCAYDKRLAMPRAAADPRQVERFLDLLGEWRARTRQPMLISWLGGEPLLWKPLTELTRRARANGIDISTTTNGTTLASPRVRRHLLESYREVTVSVDGFSDFHDRMRGWPGAFDKLRSGVTQLATERDQTGAPLRLRANVVLMRGNIARFADLCRELASWGICEISFNQLGGRDRPEFFPDNRLTPDDVEALRAVLAPLRRELAAHSVRLLGGSAYLDRIRDSALDVALPVADCRVAEQFLFIDEFGRIAPCSFAIGHFGIGIADLRETADIDSLGARLNAHQRRAPSDECSNCRSTQQFSKFDTGE
jgi:MoaA/NifB/PqqE/SkfB family radical SAM enzyme